MKILHVDSSILGSQSVSRKISAASVQRLLSIAPGATVVYRDLAVNPVPQFSPEVVLGAAGAGETLSSNPDLVALQDVLGEVLDADIIVIGAPMYNFSIPSQLKSWLDAIVVPGKTFRYSATGVDGLLGGKRVIVASARGGVYEPESPAAGAEHQESLLQSLLGFLGIRDIEIVRAEGVRMGQEQAATAIASALARAGRLEVNCP
ncbi:MAG TPA: NAD(P)H-dependent oxidoreductase [Lysobacter sp.]